MQDKLQRAIHTLTSGEIQLVSGGAANDTSTMYYPIAFGAGGIIMTGVGLLASCSFCCARYRGGYTYHLERKRIEFVQGARIHSPRTGIGALVFLAAGIGLFGAAGYYIINPGSTTSSS